MPCAIIGVRGEVGASFLIGEMDRRQRSVHFFSEELLDEEFFDLVGEDWVLVQTDFLCLGGEQLGLRPETPASRNMPRRGSTRGG
jgi:hypothetical protein